MTEEIRYTYPQKPRQTTDWMIVDIETVGRTDVAHLLKEPEANRTLKDPDKVAADLAKKIADRDSSLALDMNTCRIVAIGVMLPGEDPNILLLQDEVDESKRLNQLWTCYGGQGGINRRKVIGFNIRGFDVPILMQRTRLLGMPEPALDWGRYSREIVDIAETLACGDPKYGTSLMSRSLKNYCSLFGIDHGDDDCDGSEIAKLYAAGDWDGIAKHCAADVKRTHQLAQRLGVVA